MSARVIHIDAATKIPVSELEFRFTRSAGPGGQNVNKVSTRVELLFDVERSGSLERHQKEKIFSALKSRIGEDGVMRVAAQESRSQWRNREEAVEKFTSLLRRALASRKPRIPTFPSPSSRESKVRNKMSQARKKLLRRRVDKDHDTR